MLVSLAPFQDRLPRRNEFLWLHVLCWYPFEPLLNACSVEKNQPVWDKYRGRPSLPSREWLQGTDFKTLATLLSQTLEHLMYMGLVWEEKMGGYDGGNYWQFHPFLTTLLRGEIAKVPNDQAKKVWNNLKSMFWNFYEYRSAWVMDDYITQKIHHIDMDIFLAAEHEHRNLKQAIRVYAAQESFPVVSTDLVTWIEVLTSGLNTTRESHSWLNVLARLHQRYIEVGEKDQWAGKSLADELKQGFLRSALNLSIKLLQMNSIAGDVFEPDSLKDATIRLVDILSKGMSLDPETEAVKLLLLLKHALESPKSGMTGENAE